MTNSACPPSENQQTPQQLRDSHATLAQQMRLRTAMIEMLHDVASQVHEAATVDEAVDFTLRRVAEFNGWSFGHAFVISPDDADRLVPLRAYYEQPRGMFRTFRERTGGLTFRRGVGLPGRAAAAAEPVWAEALPNDLRPERAKAVEDLPVKSAAAFPVTVDDRVELVLEFFGVQTVDNDERLRQGMEHVAIHLARTIERLRSVATLRRSEQRFRELVERMSQAFWVLDVTREQLEYVSPNWSGIVGAPASEIQGHPENLRRYVHPDDRLWVDEEFAATSHEGRYNVLYRVVRSDGEIRWIRDIAVPVQDETGRVRRILGLAEDVTERRKLEREIADAATSEQQRLSRDLHDSIGQELTGLTMMAASLSMDLSRTAPEKSVTAGYIFEGLKRTLHQVRRISSGLASVDTDAGGLTLALAQLAHQTNLTAMSECVFRGDEPVPLGDPAVAIHLFRIAREAVSHAVTHARAPLVTLSLERRGPHCELVVEDDGPGPPDAIDLARPGIGRNVMQYWADLIGARFHIGPAPSGGTRVTCLVRLDGQPA